MSKAPTPRPETLAAQAMGWIEPTYHGLAPAIHTATTYERAGDGTYPGGRDYGRDLNPTFEQAEALLAALEGGAAAKLFASGMAATAALFQALAPGDHVVASRAMYWGTRVWLSEIGRGIGLEVDFVASDDLDRLRGAVRRGQTKLVWIETPANPTWEITDIAGAAAIAHEAGARLAVDNTVATPVFTQPLALGADLVMHSATKYLNGHSDVIAGALVSARDDELWQRVGFNRAKGGAVLGPFEAWLLLRGMRTLFVRVRAAAAGAAAIADALAGDPALGDILYPGLAHHPNHEVARRQMSGGFGGMLSLRLAGGEAAAMRLAATLRIFKRATSLGGVESLVEHRASIEGPGSLAPPDLLRLSVGIEDPADLIDDLRSALASL